MAIFRRVDTAELPHDGARVFQAISEFSRYASWWPRRFKVRYLRHTAGLVGSQVDFTPGPMVRVGWEIAGVEPGARLDIEYHLGPHTGTGCWTVEPLGQRTRISYGMQIVPKNPLWTAVYRVANVPAVHSRDLQEIFRSLDAYLARSPAR